MKRSTAYVGDMLTLHELLGKSTGEKLRIIREKLDGMYPGEYSIKKVAEQCGLTYHGIRKLETGESEPRKSTVHVLADYYNVPLSVISADTVVADSGPSLILDTQTFFLGKKEDMSLYFDDYLAEWGQPHILDPRREMYFDFEEDPQIQKVEYDESGNPSLNDISIEISIKVFQNKTDAKVLERNITERSPFSEEDIDKLQDLIRQQVKLVSDYYMKLKEARSHQ